MPDSSSGPVLLGVDVGTTNVKSAAYSPEGQTLAVSSAPLQVDHPRPGWSEYDAETLFQLTAQTLRAVIDRLSTYAVAGLAVSSMAETAVAVGKAGQPLRRAIAWHDERTTDQAAWWRAQVGDERVYAICGLPVLPIFGINKLMWMREHEPDRFAAIESWLNIADYVAYRLCGIRATNLSLASRLMALDLNRREWSDELLAACEVDRRLLGDLVPSGVLLGHVHAEGAAITGLREGTPVIAGGHDHPCGALAVGIHEPGDVLDSMGTSESIFTVTNRPVLSAALAHTGYQQGIHVDPARFYCNGGLYTSGAAVEWIRDALGLSDESYAALVNLAGSAPIGSGGVYFLPHLRLASPPEHDERARGAFIGLSSSSTRAHLLRAVLEGLAYEAQYSLDGLEHFLNFKTKRVRAIGGGTRNLLLLTIKASLLGLPVEVAQVEEASTLGAAILAGVGTGVYPDLAAGITAMRVAYRQVQPEEEMQAVYQRGYRAVYRNLYRGLAPLHHLACADDAQPS